MTPGSAALFPSPDHHWARFARRFFFQFSLFALSPLRSLVPGYTWSNLEPKRFKRTVAHAVCTGRCWTLPRFTFRTWKNATCYCFSIKILRNHLLSEHMQWNYASFNVKSNSLTSNCRNASYVATYRMSFPSLEQSRTYLMHDHGTLVLDNWGQKYCQTLGFKPYPSIPQCDY